VDPVKHSLTYYVALAEGRRPYRNALIRAGWSRLRPAPHQVPIGRWPALVSSGCTPSACSALRKTEHAQS